MGFIYQPNRARKLFRLSGGANMHTEQADGLNLTVSWVSKCNEADPVGPRAR